jgi:hypothetical protein
MIGTAYQVAIGAYELVAGIGILAWWSRDISSSRNRKKEWASHVLAELLTAVALISGGALALLGGFHFPLSLVGLSMLLYATVNAAGGTLAKDKFIAFLMVAGGVLTAAILILML